MPPTSSTDTTLAPWAGVRVGLLRPLEGSKTGLALGGDLALVGGGLQAEGTPDVRTTRLFGALEARALAVPLRVTSTFSAWSPYAFVGVLGGLGIRETLVFGEERRRQLSTWAARAGGGLELVSHHVLLRLELSGGLRDLRPDIWSTLAAGLAF